MLRQIEAFLFRVVPPIELPEEPKGLGINVQIFLGKEALFSETMAIDGGMELENEGFSLVHYSLLKRLEFSSQSDAGPSLDQ